MFDIKWISDNADAFDRALARRGLEPMSGPLIKLDEQRRAVLARLQEAQASRNAKSKEIGKAMGAKDVALAEKLKAEVAGLKDVIAEGEQAERDFDGKIREALSVIPNLPAADVPDGKDEKDNVEVRRHGTPPKLSFTPKHHFELGEALGMMDFETAAKLSGARFVVLKGKLARLERALAQFMLDLHTGPAEGQLGGYTEVNPPFMVRDDAMFGTGQLPKFADDLFKTSRSAALDELGDELEQELRAIVEEHRKSGDQGSAYPWGRKRVEARFGSWIDRVIFPGSARALRADAIPPRSVERYLIPTAEVPLTNLVRESIVPEDQLPMRLTAWTPCFRAEAGAAGRDVRGMIRQHQFAKVEMVSITTPEQSQAEHERMTASAEEVLKRLGLAFRTMLLCTGDMGFGAQKTYDIEVWLPGQDAYREISSCSVCGDFQARRMDARFRPKDGGKPQFVHTLNGSGLAVGRTLIAVMENYQQADGSIVVPEVLSGYMGGVEVIR